MNRYRMHSEALDPERLQALKTVRTGAEIMITTLVHTLGVEGQEAIAEQLIGAARDAKEVGKAARAGMGRRLEPWTASACRALHAASVALTSGQGTVAELETITERLALAEAVLRDGHAVVLGRTRGPEPESKTLTIKEVPEKMEARLGHLHHAELWLLNTLIPVWLSHVRRRED